MGEFSLVHWLVVLAILLLFFGPSKLPALGSSLGKAIRGFKSGLNGESPQSNQNHNPQLDGSQSAAAQSTEAQKAKDPQRG